MKTIYEYQLEMESYQTLHLPAKAKILCFQLQEKVPMIWAEVDTEAANEQRQFVIIGTGFDLAAISSDRQYIGTVQDNQFVWHLFEVGI